MCNSVRVLSVLANVSAMAEFTILDAPETPAPVFAFRALRNVIFGSPNDDDEGSKENASSPKQAPTLRSKISALTGPSLSPSKRRKTNQYASPAKSILRTPGVPTPRKQNTNVTFKDVTPSLSPQLTRKAPALNVVLTPEDAKGAVVAAQPSTKRPLPIRPSETSNTVLKPANKNQAAPASKSSEQTSATFDVEAYKLSTEKEMKKLVRYGQKMREYARKQDEEHTKLRIALEQLQKENEELRNRERLRGANQMEEQEQRKDVEEGRQRQVSTTRSGRKMSNMEEEKQRARGTTDRRHADSRSISATHRKADARETNPPKHKPVSPLKRKASTQLQPEPSLARKTQDPVQPDPQAAGSGVDGKAPITGPGTARLPVERLAAARERIRLKAELRRKTIPGASSPVNWNAL
jgi:hypothetical protein